MLTEDSLEASITKAGLKESEHIRWNLFVLHILNLSAPDRVGEALAGMTVEQKAAQLLVAGIEGTEPGEDAVQAIQGYQVGGVILFGRNVESAEQLALSLK